MKIRVVTHSNEERMVEVTDYDPISISQTINARDDLTIVIGDRIFSTIDVKLIEPVMEEETT